MSKGMVLYFVTSLPGWDPSVAGISDNPGWLCRSRFTLTFSKSNVSFVFTSGHDPKMGTCAAAIPTRTEKIAKLYILMVYFVHEEDGDDDAV